MKITKLDDGGYDIGLKIGGPIANWRGFSASPNILSFTLFCKNFYVDL